MDNAEVRFAARMKRERENRQWRLLDLATRAAAEGLSLHVTAYSKIENGQRPVSLSEAEAIAATFGVPLGYMLTSTEPSVIERELDQARADLAEASAASGAELARAAAAMNRIQELTVALERERAGYSPPDGT